MLDLILINKAEQTNVFADHLRVAKVAFPDTAVCAWSGKPPPLRGKSVLRIGNSYFLGTDQFVALEHRLREARKVYTIVNDYTSAPPSQIKRALRSLVSDGIEVIALTTVNELDTLTKWKGDWYSESRYVDWNRASYMRNPYKGRRSAGIIYWGALRTDRIPSFEKYLDTRRYLVSLSGSHRSRSKWEELCPAALWRGRLSLDECAAWQSTIYMEDERQHGEHHSVASRFYEAIGRGMLVLVDEKAVPAFKKSGIDLYDWCVVRHSKDVKVALEVSERLRHEQQLLMVRDYFKDTVNQLRQAITER